jgi:hypothetical protein
MSTPCNEYSTSISNKQTIYTALLIALAFGFYYWGLTENVDPLIIKGLALALVIMAFLPIFYKPESMMGHGGGGSRGPVRTAGSGSGDRRSRGGDDM